MRTTNRNKIIFLFTVFCLLSVVFTGCSAQPEEVRKPAVAGAFYPGGKSALKKMIGDLLGKAAEDGGAGIPDNAHLVGLIVPHAGYIYSGQVAAHAFKLLKDRHFDTVILIGPSHYEAFDGISIYPRGYWKTPLGRVAIDEEISILLMKKSSRIRSYPPAHTREHSLEVEIPFLQMALKDFRIVPLVMGRNSPQNCRVLADAILNVVQTFSSTSLLIIASSDMSHYHSYGKACLMDGLCLESIGSLDVEKLQGNLSRGIVELCGAGPVLTLMEIGNKLKAKAKILKYANSGDVPAGEKSRVVGYCAAAFYISDSSSRSKEEGMLSEEQQKRLLEIARRTLEDHIRDGKIPEFKEGGPQLIEKRGAFVTLTKKGGLRGCIGYIEPVLPLYKAISEMAIKSSTGDPRFPPVKPEELKDIRIEISVLSPIELIKDVNKIEVGKHGLIIRKGFFSGLLLPQVATSCGWNKWQFLDQTCRKAGLPPGSWKDEATQIYIFSAQVFGEE